MCALLCLWIVTNTDQYTKQIFNNILRKNKLIHPPIIYNAMASFNAMHNNHMSQLLDTLNDEGLAENTLVVWWSDNGPMDVFYPTGGSTWLKGGKGSVTEGGVRVPAMAWWPGMIAPNQDPLDVIHLTDLFTTAARLGGAMDAGAVFDH